MCASTKARDALWLEDETQAMLWCTSLLSIYALVRRHVLPLCDLRDATHPEEAGALLRDWSSATKLAATEPQPTIPQRHCTSDEGMTIYEQDTRDICFARPSTNESCIVRVTPPQVFRLTVSSVADVLFASASPSTSQPTARPSLRKKKGTGND